MLVCFHAADAGYGRYAADWGETSTMSTFALVLFPRELLAETVGAPAGEPGGGFSGSPPQ